MDDISVGGGSSEAAQCQVSAWCSTGVRLASVTQGAAQICEEFLHGLRTSYTSISHLVSLVR